MSAAELEPSSPPTLLSDDASTISSRCRTPNSGYTEVMVSLALVLPRAGRAGTLTVEPPRIPTECEAYPITWTGGTPPYTVTIVSPRAPPDNVFSDIDETHFIWTPDVPATFSVSFQVEDSTGSSVQTSAVTVRRGLDESCLSAGSPGSASQPSDSPTSSSSLPEPPSSSPSPSPSPSETSTTSTTALTPPTSQPQNPPFPSSDQASPPGDTHTPSPGSPGISSGAVSQPVVSTASPSSSGFPTNPAVPPGSGSLGNSPATSGTTTIPSPSVAMISGSSTLIPPSDTSQPTALAPEMGKHSMNLGIIAGIIVAAITLIVVLVAILVQRHRRRSAGAALRPDAFTTRKALVLPVGASHTESSSWNSDLPTVTGHRDSKKSRFSVATDSSSIRAPTTVSSANAEPPTHIGSNDPSAMGELIELVATTASRSSSSSSPAKGTQDAPRNAIQEVLEALRAASPPIPSSDNSDCKWPEVATPQPSVRAARRERTRSPMERRQMWEEDGGVRLAGGPLDEPAQEVLPPPYRRY